MQLIFTFTINQENGEATFAGNIEPPVALQILQQLVIADAVQKARRMESRGNIIEDKEVQRTTSEKGGTGE